MGSIEGDQSTMESSRRTTRSLMKRRDGLIKKASELATLCEADVCLISYSPFEGDRIVTWPSDDSTVRRHIARFYEAKRTGLVKQIVGPTDIFDDERKVEEQNSRPSSNREREIAFGSWHHILDNCSRISLMRLASHLEEKLSTVNQKIVERGNHSVENEAVVTNDHNVSINNSGSDSIREREVVNNHIIGGCSRFHDESNYNLFVKELDVLKTGGADCGDCSRSGSSSSQPAKKQKIARDDDDDDGRKVDDDGPCTELKLSSSTTRNREKEEGNASAQLSLPAATEMDGLVPQNFASSVPIHSST